MSRLSHGSVCYEGEGHYEMSLGIQDALAIRENEDGSCIVAVICDGVSLDDENRASQNQFGAIFFANALASALHKSDSKVQFETRLKRCQGTLINSLREVVKRRLLIDAEPAVWDSFVTRFLLFTVVGLCVEGDAFHIFGCGDGAYGDDHDINLRPTVAHLGERLRRKDYRTESPSMTVWKTGSFVDQGLLWIASDGLFPALSGRPQPWHEFLRDDRLCARDDRDEDLTSSAFDDHLRSGRSFHDDTTLFLVRGGRDA